MRRAPILTITSLFCIGALQAATSIKTIYIVPSSHYDRGFVVPPQQIPAMAARHINEVLDAAQNDPEFRWTIESVWQVLAFIEDSRGLGDILPGHLDRVDALMKLIRSGRVDVSAAWGSMHAEFMGAEELNRLMYDFAALRRTYGIDSELAMLDDVPGQPFSTASVLAGSGVRYLLLGANQFIGGGTSLSPGNVPFYWQGPDGKRVLTWVSQSPRGGYTEGITDYFLDPFTNDPYLQTSGWKVFNPKSPDKTPLEQMETGVAALLKKYGDAGYRYDSILVMHLHDFLHPSTVGNLERAVHLWNSSHATPQLRIATGSEFFRYMEEKYGSVIPTVRGEWSGLWSESKTSSPQISALARRAHDEVPAAETLWTGLALQKQAPTPAADFYKLYHLLFNYDEHSGAGNVGWPGLNDEDKLQAQNRQYVEFMQAATHGSDYLLHGGIELLAASNQGQRSRPVAPTLTWPLTVWNSLSWTRTDVVTAPSPERGWHISAVRHRRTGQTVAFDTEENGNALFFARDVPSLGYATFDVDVSPGEAKSSLTTQDNELSAESSRFRVTLARDGTIASILDRKGDRELVNQHASVPFNYLLRTAGDQPAPVPMPFVASVTQRHGQIFTELEVKRIGSGFPLTRIRLFNGIDRVEIHDEINSAVLPFASVRSGFDTYLFSFPFALDAGTLTVHPEEQFGFVSLPNDYLPGARRDAVTSQHAMGLSDANATVLLAHRQAFHFVFPGYVRTQRSASSGGFPAMYTGKWPLPEATLFSRAFRHSSQGDMRLQGVTNFETVEPGLGDHYDFDYAVGAAAAPLDPVLAMRFGAEFDVPLRAVYVPFAESASRSLFAVDQPNVRIDVVKQAEAGATDAITPTNLTNSESQKRYVIRLQEVAGRDTPRATVSLPGRIAGAEIVNLTEDKVISTLPANAKLIVPLAPYATVTVRFEVASEQ